VRALKAILKVFVGLALGVVLAEVAFSARDHGAFPHVNLYVEDQALGVRLQPNVTMQLKVAGNNPVTTAATNSLGFRSPEWPAPTKGEVLVVGDSQVFGLGVEAHETFSAKLSEQLGVPVLNAGVPTYGPREYTAMVKQVLGQRKTVGTVVYVLNLSNDLFEADRPNAQRHKVWDGWAVRAETAPTGGVTNFPFRRALMSKSHLVYGVRKLLHSGGEGGEAVSTEGSWRDVAEAGRGVTPLPPEDEGAKKLLAARSDLDRQLENLAQQLQGHLEGKLEQEKYVAELKPLIKSGDPRDILFDSQAEGARRNDITAYHLFVAAVGATRNEKLLEAVAKKKKDPELLALLEARKELRAKLDALKPEGEAPHVQPLDQVLLDTKALCDAAGAKLVVVALPLDVMVSAEEWKKYVGSTPIDMSATQVLREDLVARAERIGAVGLDPTAALAAAEPGAFLDADLHMTPKGHAALAGALVEALKAPVKPKNAYVLPEGRSWPPTEDEFRRADECTVKGSTNAGCETKLVREWLRVACGVRKQTLEAEVDGIEGVEVLEGGHGDALAWQEDEQVVLIVPVLEGDATRAKFHWSASQQVLKLDWPKGGALTMAFDTLAPRRREDAVPEVPWQSYAYLYAESLKTGRPKMELFQREMLQTGKPRQRGARELEPCAEGEVKAGARLQCWVSCDATHPCAKGHCEPWPTGSFCAIP